MRHRAGWCKGVNVLLKTFAFTVSAEQESGRLV